jgi:hypothetical protein
VATETLMLPDPTAPHCQWVSLLGMTGVPRAKPALVSGRHSALCLSHLLTCSHVGLCSADLNSAVVSLVGMQELHVELCCSDSNSYAVTDVNNAAMHK